MPLDVQFRVFLLLVLTGMAVGALYDLTRGLRWGLRARGAWVHLGDLAFWLLATATLIAGAFRGNWLELRSYVFIAVALGLFLYFTLASPVVLFLLVKLIRLIRRAIRALGRAAVWLGELMWRAARLAAVPAVLLWLLAGGAGRRLGGAAGRTAGRAKRLGSRLVPRRRGPGAPPASPGAPPGPRAGPPPAARPAGHPEGPPPPRRRRLEGWFLRWFRRR